MQRRLFLIALYVTIGLIPFISNVGQNLEYEYALLLSWAALLLVPLAAAALSLEFLGVCEGAFKPSRVGEAYWIFIVSPVASFLPGVMAFIAGSCSCSSTGFAFWMTVLTYPALVLAHGIHHFILCLRIRGMRRMRALLALGLSYLIIAFFVAGSLWFNPQKRIVDPFAGFLHGPVYDAWIPLDHGIILARLAAIFCGAMILAFAWWKNRAFHWGMAVLAVGGWLALSLWADSYDSIQMGTRALDRLLPQVIAHDGFRLHYRAESPNSSTHEIPRDILTLDREAQFHFNELTKILETTPKKPIEIYVYPNQDDKKLWFGGGATDVTDVHSPSVHITADGLHHPTLRHELVHAIASDFGFYGLGFHPNMAFTEGIAEALAPDDGTISLDDGAAAVIESKKVPDVHALFSPLFWREAGPRSYTVAGSLINYLLHHHGIAGVKAKYSGQSWEKAFGQSEGSVIAEWQTKILGKFDKQAYSMYTEALYRDPGVFRSLCPHSRVDLRQARGDSIYLRLRQPIGWKPEEDYLPWIEKIEPKNVGHRITAWKRQIAPIAKDFAKFGTRLSTWLKVIKQAENQPPKTLEDVELAILESDILRLTGKASESIAVLDGLAEFGKATYLGDSFVREIAARRLIETLNLYDAAQWRAYLGGWSPPPRPAPNTGEPWILTYLHLRRLPAENVNLAKLQELDGVQVPPELPKTFHVEWFRSLANRYEALGEFAKAALAWSKASESARGSSQDLLSQHSRLAAFTHEFQNVTNP